LISSPFVRIAIGLGPFVFGPSYDQDMLSIPASTWTPDSRHLLVSTPQGIQIFELFELFERSAPGVEVTWQSQIASHPDGLVIDTPLSMEVSSDNRLLFSLEEACVPESN